MTSLRPDRFEKPVRSLLDTLGGVEPLDWQALWDEKFHSEIAKKIVDCAVSLMDEWFGSLFKGEQQCLRRAT